MVIFPYLQANSIMRVRQTPWNLLFVAILSLTTERQLSSEFHGFHVGNPRNYNTWVYSLFGRRAGPNCRILSSRCSILLGYPVMLNHARAEHARV